MSLCWKSLSCKNIIYVMMMKLWLEALNFSISDFSGKIKHWGIYPSGSWCTIFLWKRRFWSQHKIPSVKSHLEFVLISRFFENACFDLNLHIWIRRIFFWFDFQLLAVSIKYFEFDCFNWSFHYFRNLYSLCWIVPTSSSNIL